MSAYLVTGAFGFISSDFVHYLVDQYPHAHIVKQYARLMSPGELNPIFD
jgi:dTDP-D-glucose 4,6-dehydratase